MALQEPLEPEHRIRIGNRLRPLDPVVDRRALGVSLPMLRDQCLSRLAFIETGSGGLAHFRRGEFLDRTEHLHPGPAVLGQPESRLRRSEEHTSELQSLMRISYAVFCLKKKTKHDYIIKQHTYTTKQH